MRRRLTLRDARTGYGNDVLVELDDEATVADLVATAGTAMPADGPLHLGRQVLGPHERLDRPDLVDGTVLSVDGPGPEPVVLPERTLCIIVVSGPDAGRVLPVTPDSTVRIGRGPDATLRLADPYLSRDHARLEIDGEGACTLHVVTEQEGTTRVERTAVPSGSSIALAQGQLVETAASAWIVTRTSTGDARLTADPGGGRTFNRVPRIAPEPERPAVIERPVAMRDDGDDGPIFPTYQLAIPLVGAIAMAFVFREPRFLMMALLSPAMLLGNTFSERTRRRRQEARDESRFADRSEAADQAMRDALAHQQATARAASPDPATLLLALAGPGRRLWERRPTDDDHLDLRIGLGTRRADIDLRGEPDHERRPPLLHDVPIGLPLEALGVIGVAGPRPNVRAVTRNLLLQVIALHSPDDVRVVLLTDPTAEPDWGWLAWAPHARLDEAGDVAAIGCSVDTVDARIKGLTALLTARRNDVARGAGAIAVPLPRIVVVFDGAHDLRSRPGAATILDLGPSVGIYTLCLDDDLTLLPEECNGTVDLDRRDDGLVPTTATVARTGHAPVTGVLVDQVAAGLMEVGARRIAPIRRISGTDVSRSLPQAVRLLDLIDLEPPDPRVIAARWRTERSPTAPMGRTADGVATIDLEGDGPHGLVGGTTGSGKSEFLLGLIGSLAATHRPDELAMVLVDYKGGATFAPCAPLPHCVGFITNLDGHLTRRVQQSLTAEVQWRQARFGQVGATDLAEHRKAIARLGPDGAHLRVPRLLVVFDEFSELVDEAPDFVPSLVKIARTGRSLGVHLLLATQRPRGAVSPEIRSNSKLRVALRVADPGDSEDVIDRPDAASISSQHPGRGYLTTGVDRFELVQTAFAGGLRPTAEQTVGEPRVVVRSWDSVGTSLPPRRRTSTADHEGAKPKKDLDVLVEALGVAWDEVRGDIVLRRPWLPPLPPVLRLDAVDPPVDLPLTSVPYGHEDRPWEQSQGVASWNLEEGHLAAIGGARSGRSTLLRTLAVSAVQRLGADRVALSVFDCGGGSLGGLSACASAGTVVGGAETDRGVRLVQRLVERLVARQRLLSANGWRGLPEQWAATPRDEHLPYEVVLVDRWEGFMDSFGEHADSPALAGMRKILAEGASVGMVVAVTGDVALLAPRHIGTVRQRIGLALTDRSRYVDLALDQGALPEEVLPGQGFVGGSGAEVRVATLTEDLGGPAQDQALAAVLAVVSRARRGGDLDPVRLDVLPTDVSVDRARTLGPAPTGRFPVLAGVGGDTLEARWVDLADTSGLAVVGPRSSGRTTTLATVAASAIAEGASVIIVGRAEDDLAVVATDPAVLAHVPSIDDERLRDLLEDHDRRIVVVIDDAPSLTGDTAIMEDLVRKGPVDHRVVIGAQAEDVEGGWGGYIPSLMKRAAVVHLSPRKASTARLIGVDIPNGAEFNGPEGRAYLAVGGGPARMVQVPRLPRP